MLDAFNYNSAPLQRASPLLVPYPSIAAQTGQENCWVKGPNAGQFKLNRTAALIARDRARSKLAAASSRTSSQGAATENNASVASVSHVTFFPTKQQMVKDTEARTCENATHSIKQGMPCGHIGSLIDTILIDMLQVQHCCVAHGVIMCNRCCPSASCADMYCTHSTNHPELLY